jgi:hypothetical protein
MSVSKASLRGLRMSERIKKMREAAPTRPTVKVTPKDDTIRRVLKHPRGGGFPKEGPATWPDDRFTFRRLRDGDITVSDGERRAHRNDDAA